MLKSHPPPPTTLFFLFLFFFFFSFFLFLTLWASNCKTKREWERERERVATNAIFQVFFSPINFTCLYAVVRWIARFWQRKARLHCHWPAASLFLCLSDRRARGQEAGAEQAGALQPRTPPETEANRSAGRPSRLRRWPRLVSPLRSRPGHPQRLPMLPATTAVQATTRTPVRDFNRLRPDNVRTFRGRISGRTGTVGKPPGHRQGRVQRQQQTHAGGPQPRRPDGPQVPLQSLN